MTGSQAALCALDWGTSSLRGYVIDRDGRILQHYASEDGILAIEDGDFEAVLFRAMQSLGCADQDLPILASGMITSRQGWQETGYLPCPAGLEAFAGGLKQIRLKDGRTIHFVPGIAYHHSDGYPDVMRGEETQLLAIANRRRRQIAILPGTHSKWAMIDEDGQIAWFATFMTGELFAVLSKHSILGRLMAPGNSDAAAFAQGINAIMENPDNRYGRLFSARTLPLFDQLDTQGVADYLSGLLIGSEIVEARRAISDQFHDNSMVLIGAEALVERYRSALSLMGFKPEIGESDAAALGLWRIAEKAGLVR